jgi:hypothetical protein
MSDVSSASSQSQSSVESITPPASPAPSLYREEQESPYENLSSSPSQLSSSIEVTGSDKSNSTKTTTQPLKRKRSDLLSNVDADTDHTGDERDLSGSDSDDEHQNDSDDSPYEGEMHRVKRRSPLPASPTIMVSPTATPATPVSSEPSVRIDDQERTEYDRQFENMCRRLPNTMQLRPSFMPYTANVGYLDPSIQMTDVRGRLEPAANLFAEQQQAAQQQLADLFRDMDDLLDDDDNLGDLSGIQTMDPNENLQTAIRNPAATAFINREEYRGEEDANIGVAQPSRTATAPPEPQPLPPPPPMQIGNDDEPFDMNMAAMLGDVMQQQVTFITSPLPKHLERKRANLARYARDGIRDVRAVIENCIICSYMIDVNATEGGKKSLTDESIREFQAICKWVVKRPMLITCAAASKYWNSTFVKACENCKVPAPPKLTPSHVELCLLNCNHNLKGLLTLRREIALLEDVLDVLESNQLFVRQEVANVPTNKYQVTQSGYKVYHDVVNQLITCRKLEWGAMTVIEHENEDSPVSVNPMHDSSYRPKKRTEITREREAYIAAQKRNNKNFRGSSGMGGNTGVGVLQIGGYGGGITGGHNTARSHQMSQRQQLFNGPL